MHTHMYSVKHQKQCYQQFYNKLLYLLQFSATTSASIKIAVGPSRIDVKIAINGLSPGCDLFLQLLSAPVNIFFLAPHHDPGLVLGSTNSVSFASILRLIVALPPSFGSVSGSLSSI